jgi:hypothetical protein
MVAQAYTPSYLEEGVQDGHSLRPAWAKSSQNPYTCYLSYVGK